ncbi:MAG TPA: DedA family protein [Candidatus Tumulicola sp.]|jgi:membrane protein DedA with SNARE-associated domain
MEHLQHFVIDLIDKYGYGGLFLTMVMGNIGLPVGAELVLPISGALTATKHLASIWLTIAVVVSGECAGQTLAYAIGRYGGVPVLERYGKYVGFHHRQLEVVHGFFARYGTFSIFICRFLPVVRGVAGFPAGIAEMHYGAFILWTLLSSLVLCSLLVGLGYQLGDHLDRILPLLHRWGTLGGIIAVIVVVAGIIVWSLMRKRNPSTREGDSNSR